MTVREVIRHLKGVPRNCYRLVVVDRSKYYRIFFNRDNKKAASMIWHNLYPKFYVGYHIFDKCYTVRGTRKGPVPQYHSRFLIKEEK